MDIDTIIGHLAAASSVLQNSSYDGIGDVPSLPQTNEPIWFLGNKYVMPSEKSDLEADVRTKLWFTYRRNFNSIGGGGPTSDQGWGCMLRCGQMMLAQAILSSHIGRNWKWTPEPNEAERENSQKFNKILRLFLDERDFSYSVHQIASMGETEGKAIGEWFGPNTVAQVLRKLSAYDKWSNVFIHICMDNLIIINEIISHCKRSKDDSQVRDKAMFTIGTDVAIDQSEKDSTSWKPLLLVIPVRLGLSDINPTYYNQLKACFRLEQSVGVLGGRPSHAFWLVGYTEDNLLYFDPHVTQQRVDPHDDEKLHETFHIRCPSHIDIKELDPSMALGFFCKTEEDFKRLCQSFQSKVIGRSPNPIFEIYSIRPSHLIDIFKPQSPKMQSTAGRSDDDYEEFEII